MEEKWEGVDNEEQANMFTLLPKNANHDEAIFAEAPVGGGNKVSQPQEEEDMVRASRENLPSNPCNFSGRQFELYSLVDRIINNRLVTLSGGFGMGKSKPPRPRERSDREKELAAAAPERPLFVRAERGGAAGERKRPYLLRERDTSFSCALYARTAPKRPHSNLLCSLRSPPHPPNPLQGTLAISAARYLFERKHFAAVTYVKVTSAITLYGDIHDKLRALVPVFAQTAEEHRDGGYSNTSRASVFGDFYEDERPVIDVDFLRKVRSQTPNHASSGGSGSRVRRRRGTPRPERNGKRVVAGSLASRGARCCSLPRFAWGTLLPAPSLHGGRVVARSLASRGARCCPLPRFTGGVIPSPSLRGGRFVARSLASRGALFQVLRFTGGAFLPAPSLRSVAAPHPPASSLRSPPRLTPKLSPFARPPTDA
jgi:hypothetical protein